MKKERVKKLKKGLEELSYSNIRPIITPGFYKTLNITTLTLKITINQLELQRII